MLICKNCNTKNLDIAKFCKECGLFNLYDPDYHKKQKEEREKDKKERKN